MLPPAVRNKLVIAFRDSMSADHGRLGIWVQFQLGVSLALFTRPNLLFDGVVFELLDWVNGQGRAKWVELLTVNDFASGDYPTLRAACGEALAALVGPAAADDAPDLTIWTDVPFVDRQQVRTDLDELTRSPNKRVLVVDGSPRTGKSYLSEYILHRCSGRPPTRPPSRPPPTCWPSPAGWPPWPARPRPRPGRRPGRPKWPGCPTGTTRWTPTWPGNAVVAVPRS